jgi:phenylacetaldehyde dehydrogenase
MRHTNPTTEQLSEIEETPLDRIPEIVSTTRQAQTAWGPLSVAERATILRAHSKAIETRRDALREAITQDMGKPIRNSDIEVSRCVSAAEFLIDHAQEWLRPEPRDCGMIHFDPMGLGAAITPWNAPLVIPMFQILPSLLAGNAVVWKPSEFAPKTAQLYFDALTDFLPDNVVSVVVGGKDRGQALVEENFEFLTFTGSTATGRYIAERSARNFTRLQLELGGVDAALVLDDVDPVAAAEAIVKINASNTGQICCSIKRVYVEAAVYSDFVQAAAEASKRITVGDPREDVVMGPLASQMQLDKCQDFLNDALQQGAVLQSGGSRLSRPGFFFPHTVLSDLNPNTRLLREEAFGPLLPILPVASAEEAVQLANSLPMALTASVWGKDSPRSKKIVSQLAGGVVGLNRHGVPPVGCPWGGARHSGMGRARSIEGMRECCNTKFVY